MTTSIAEQVARVARHAGTCGAPGCLAGIWPGAAIIKPPGRAWQHADCSDPGKRERNRPRPSAAARH